MSKKINNEVMEIKHMAFAVEDIEQSLGYYKDFLGVSKEIEIQDMPKSKTRVAVFNIGEIEYQLCQSMDPDGRFNKWINERGRGGLHHICYTVKNLDYERNNTCRRKWFQIISYYKKCIQTIIMCV